MRCLEKINTVIFYIPNKELPRFDQKNVIADSAVKKSELLSQLFRIKIHKSLTKIFRKRIISMQILIMQTSYKQHLKIYQKNMQV